MSNFDSPPSEERAPTPPLICTCPPLEEPPKSRKKKSELGLHKEDKKRNGLDDADKLKKLLDREKKIEAASKIIGELTNPDNNISLKENKSVTVCSPRLKEMCVQVDISNDFIKLPPDDSDNESRRKVTFAETIRSKDDFRNANERQQSAFNLNYNQMPVYRGPPQCIPNRMSATNCNYIQQPYFNSMPFSPLPPQQQQFYQYPTNNQSYLSHPESSMNQMDYQQFTSYKSATNVAPNFYPHLQNYPRSVIQPPPPPPPNHYVFRGRCSSAERYPNPGLYQERCRSPSVETYSYYNTPSASRYPRCLSVDRTGALPSVFSPSPYQPPVRSPSLGPLPFKPQYIAPVKHHMSRQSSAR